MRFLLANQFYPPDMAPTGQHLHEIARGLVERGHEVTVLCSRRSYDGGGEYAPEEVIDGVQVRRLASFGFGRRGPARAADYLSFHAAALLASTAATPFDLALSLTTPPYVGWTLARAPRLRARARAALVMDLYPDVLAAHGSLRRSSTLFRGLAALTRRQFAGTALVLALGPRMAERVRPYVSGATRLDWVPLWGTAEAGAMTAEAACSVRAARGWRHGSCVFLYAGNMGLGHRMEEFLAASLRTGDEAVWAFGGGGQRRREVEAFGAEHPGRVQLLPYVPQDELAASLAAADVHLVSLRRDWEGLIVPSKLQAAFSLGRPVLFVGPSQNEAADWIAASGGGWHVPDGDVDGLVAAVRSACDPTERARRGAAALAFAREHFDRKTNVRRITRLLEEAAGAPSAG